ncbi:MAG TPA: DinB family protein [Candidatus Acidoferrum sp.]|nr:DinB family protein [Candidatus Acidoferrum sp.]
MKGTSGQSLLRFGTALVAIAMFGIGGTRLHGQSQAQNLASTQVRTRAEETLEWWNQMGKKLIAMAKDFPEDKYDFKVQKDQRTFGQNLVHVAAIDYDIASRVAATHVGPDFGKDKHNPPPDMYKTKVDVVKLLEDAVAAGAKVIQEQGDAGLDKTQPFGWETGRHVVRNSYIWLSGIEHSSEHFGQLVVYYRANNLVPPESRPR